MSSGENDTRIRILNATWTLLEADPGKGVRMSDIAKCAGISRQAVYLHFPTRADLLVATTRHVDNVKDVDERLSASRSAKSGIERLDAFVEAWGNYIPEIYGVATALLAMKDRDEAAAEAWRDRMDAVRQGCEAAVSALRSDGTLRPGLRSRDATDMLWTLLSVHNWEQFTRDCGWSQRQYIDRMKDVTRQLLTESQKSRC